MWKYKSEILFTKTKWVSDKVEDRDLLALDQLFNERIKEGWELATYSYMSTSMQVKGATLITFRKWQEDI